MTNQTKQEGKESRVEVKGAMQGEEPTRQVATPKSKGATCRRGEKGVGGGFHAETGAPAQLVKYPPSTLRDTPRCLRSCAFFCALGVAACTMTVGEGS